MIEKNNIDELFSNNLKDFEVNPDEKVWQEIEKKLVKKKKRVIPIWWTYSGIAAIFVMSLFIFQNISEDENIINNVTSAPDKINIDKNKIEKTLENNLQNLEEIVAVEKKDKTKSEINITNEYSNRKINRSFVESQKKSQKSLAKRTEIAYNTKPINLEIENNFQPIEIKKQTNTIDLSKKVKEEALLTLNEEKNDVSEKRKNLWSISPIVGYLSSNSYTKSSPIDSNLSMSTEGDETYSYGVQVSYKLNSKWSFQSGIHLQEIGFQNNNLIVGSSIENSSNINFDSGNSFVIADVENSNEIGTNVSSLDGNISQRYGYIEIPIEIKYNIIENSFLRTEIIAGFSSLFLNENEINLNSSTISESGEATNLNSFNFSGNVGLNFIYKIDKKWSFNLSPMLKNQLNTFDKNSNGFKPYFFGIYSGINISF